MKLKFRSPFKIEKRNASSGLKSPEQWLMNLFGAMSESGETVNASTATKLAAVYACIGINAETVASLPKMVIDESDDLRKRLTDHPVYHLIHFQPNPSMKAFDFWETVMVHLQTEGNSFARIYRNTLNVPVKLDLIPDPENVTIYQTTDGDIFYRYKGEDIAAYDMLHYHGWSKNGLRGIGPIAASADSIGLGLSAQKLGGKYFKKGNHQQGVLEYEGSFDDKAWKNFQDHFSAAYKGMENAHNGIPVLEYGMKWKDISIPADQMQLLETRQFQKTEVCTIFKVPPHLIGILDRATFSNIEHQDIQYAKYTIRGYCRRIETENDLKLFPKSEWGKTSTKFNLDGLLRGDLKTRAVQYKSGITNGYYTRNEVRKMENMPPINGLDEILTPLNMVEDSKLNNSKTNEE